MFLKEQQNTQGIVLLFNLSSGLTTVVTAGTTAELLGLGSNGLGDLNTGEVLEVERLEQILL